MNTYEALKWCYNHEGKELYSKIATVSIVYTGINSNDKAFTTSDGLPLNIDGLLISEFQGTNFNWHEEEYSNKTCATCEYHTVFYEDDYTQDGCVCDNEADTSKYHMNNCFECTVGEPGEFKGCPYYKKDSSLED